MISAQASGERYTCPVTDAGSLTPDATSPGLGAATEIADARAPDRDAQTAVADAAMQAGDATALTGDAEMTGLVAATDAADEATGVADATANAADAGYAATMAVDATTGVADAVPRAPDAAPQGVGTTSQPATAGPDRSASPQAASTGGCTMVRDTSLRTLAAWTCAAAFSLLLIGRRREERRQWNAVRRIKATRSHSAFNGTEAIVRSGHHGDEGCSRR